MVFVQQMALHGGMDVDHAGDFAPGDGDFVQGGDAVDFLAMADDDGIEQGAF